MAQTYVTQPGDSLWSIAQRFYGDGAQWQAIYSANRQSIGEDSNVIHAGVALTIPGTSAGQTYVTNDTDTLWSIAQQFYGDGTQWPRIYDANKPTIGTDPNYLTAGLSLVIPA